MTSAELTRRVWEAIDAFPRERARREVYEG